MAAPLPPSLLQQQLVSPLPPPLVPIAAQPLARSSHPSPSPPPSPPPSVCVSQARLPPDVTRILYVKSLPFKISSEDLYDIFGKFGPVRQIRLGSQPNTRGKAFVVYEDVFDAQRAVEHLNGFNIAGRYLVVLYHQGDKAKAKADAAARGSKEGMDRRREEVERLKTAFGVKGEGGEGKT